MSEDFPFLQGTGGANDYPGNPAQSPNNPSATDPNPNQSQSTPAQGGANVQPANQARVAADNRQIDPSTRAQPSEQERLYQEFLRWREREQSTTRGNFREFEPCRKCGKVEGLRLVAPDIVLDPALHPQDKVDENNQPSLQCALCGEQYSKDDTRTYVDNHR